jgi:hypothetical protein
MHQRMTYWNKERGYYYFRPYHVAHTILQQERAATWGGDIRDPYDNRGLEDVYDTWAEEQDIMAKTKKVEDLPKTPGRLGTEPETMDPEKDDQLDPPPAPMPRDEKPTPEAPKAPGQGRTGQLKKFVTYR